MKPEPKRIRELFVAAVGKADPELRDAFLAEACDGDEALVRSVRCGNPWDFAPARRRALARGCSPA